MRATTLALLIATAANAGPITVPPGWDLVMDARPGDRGSIREYEFDGTGSLLMTQVVGDIERITPGSWTGEMSPLVLWNEGSPTFESDPWVVREEHYGGTVATIRWAPPVPLSTDKYASGIYLFRMSFDTASETVEVMGEVNVSVPEPSTMSDVLLVVCAVCVSYLLFTRIWESGDE